ncbi:MULTISPECIES: helix-turn-helix domain-containing protein [Fusobacterium]|uniref:Helix-turn-helix domain-containing protein n=1 Tax=Fusobacterium hominis TaxID=2764326 RepID=A0A7G9GXG7_9FUSO|nr:MULTISPECIES: helix-turn-helix domain-containing protein [Fusobacterium]MBR8702281.1 hypothetical protein [Fusobacterium sp. DD45]MBR8712098.1 hypothetical protein [Fusobacterium sp. DD28]MBR8752680.1 hypothetical protein [Fusobacterium sp. DD26]QNM15499.1 helix-turn-helix domain-containing protein [Fusobacterium hominis]
MKKDIKLIDTGIVRSNIEKKILTKTTKKELAKKIGITPQTLNTILENMSKKKNCTVASINKIAIAGKISCEELLTE